MGKLQFGKSMGFFLIVPPAICRLKGWKKGDLIDFFADPKTGEVFLKKTEPVSP